MRYLADYYWQQEQGKNSLVLKHLVYHEGEVSVLLGCLGVGKEASYLAGRMTQWFYEEGTSRLEKMRKVAEGGAESVVKVLEGILVNALSGICVDAVTDTYTDVTFIICIGECFALWNKGRQRAYILNNRFGYPHMRCVAGENARESIGAEHALESFGGGICFQPTENKKEEIICGQLQAGVAILLATKDLYERVSDKELSECLWVKELNRQDRVHRRVREIGEEAVRRGGENVAAILLVTCDSYEKI